MDRKPVRAWTGLAKPDPQERCLALVLIPTRKHRSRPSPAFRAASRKVRTGGAKTDPVCKKPTLNRRIWPARGVKSVFTRKMSFSPLPPR